MFSGVGTRSTRVPDLAHQRTWAGVCSPRTRTSPARSSDVFGPPTRRTGLVHSTLAGQIRAGVETVPTLREDAKGVLALLGTRAFAEAASAPQVVENGLTSKKNCIIG